MTLTAQEMVSRNAASSASVWTHQVYSGLVDARIGVNPERLPADGRNGHQIIEGVVSDADQASGRASSAGSRACRLAIMP